jgi:hypothetical protein
MSLGPTTFATIVVTQPGVVMSEEAEESLLDYRRNVRSARIRRGEGQWNSGGGDGRERRLVHGTYGGFD